MRITNVMAVTGDYTYKEDMQRAALRRNHRVDYALTMDDALNMLLEKDYLLAVIQADTAEDYLTKLRIMKRLKPMPILVVSYREQRDMITPIKMGADFYIAAPFNLEYILEIGCGLTRLYENGIYTNRTPKRLSYGYLSVCVDTREVLLKGNQIELTPKEFDILRFLMENEGDVVTYAEIFKEVWGDEYVDNANNVLGCMIHRLKRKLSAEPEAVNYIKNKYQVGYSFGAD